RRLSWQESQGHWVTGARVGSLAGVKRAVAVLATIGAVAVLATIGVACLAPGARALDTSHPTRVIGHGTPAGCPPAAVVAAVRAGGIIRFDCGPTPVTIRMNATAKVRNTSPRVVLDGGGLITLSGEGRRRILYMDTCDRAQAWTTSHCDDQASP